MPLGRHPQAHQQACTTMLCYPQSFPHLRELPLMVLIQYSETLRILPILQVP